MKILVFFFVNVCVRYIICEIQLNGRKKENYIKRIC